MKRLLLCLGLGVTALFFVLPADVLAQAGKQFPGDKPPYGLVPCDGGAEHPCNICAVETLVSELMLLAIYIAVFIATLLIAYAGYRLIIAQGDPGARTEAKKLITNAMIGIALVIGAFAIVNAIMSALLGQPFRDWFSFGDCTPQEQQSSTPSGNVNVGRPQIVGSGALDHEAALTLFNQAGIRVTSTDGDSGVKETCPSSNGCTQVAGLREATAQQVVRVKESCSTCELIITGAAEPHTAGTYSHAAGYKVDLDDTASVNDYLQNTLTRKGTRLGANGGPRYVDSCGNEYVKERTHWDITVYKTCDLK